MNAKYAITLFSAMFLALTMTASAGLAKDVAEAVHDMAGVENADPQGFTLMIICIGLLVTVVLTLIGFTTWYFLKDKNKKKASDQA